jgi:hypothetical protein
MARAAKTTTETETVHILEIGQGMAEFSVIGTAPLIFNRMSEKAKRTLLLPGGPKNAAERLATLKHDPVAEYRASAYVWSDDDHPTRLCFPSPALKGAIKTAALDMPGSTKAGIGRRVWVDGFAVDIYGVPKLFMSVVRSAGITNAPDIRTRAIVPQWCATLQVHYATPLVTAKTLSLLLSAGGILCGIGDWRQEKGSGSFGQFRLCEKTDADFKRIQASGGRVAQDKALLDAPPFDVDSRELLDWYHIEVLRRGRDKPLVVVGKRGRKEPANDGLTAAA